MDDYDIVIVYWEDCWADHEHSTESSWDESWPVVTLGFLVAEDDRVVHVAQEWHSGNSTFRCTSHIPGAMIQRIEVVRKAQGGGTESANEPATVAPLSPIVPVRFAH